VATEIKNSGSAFARLNCPCQSLVITDAAAVPATLKAGAGSGFGDQTLLVKRRRGGRASLRSRAGGRCATQAAEVPDKAS